MAISICTMGFGTSVSSYSNLKAKSFENTSFLCNSKNPFRFNSCGSSRHVLSRKSCRIRATLLQENEEEVVLEKSFAPKSFPGNAGGGNRSHLMIHRLMDSVIKILDTLYLDRNHARFFVLETIARVPYFGKYYVFKLLIIL
ncbi:hypothetical protein RND71_022285 [Anisodus tanguticus]|uniref:Uncharacterized protein n=1 Tax=Anisodus tanguticus TaxID=243964 RepID=A0AAE1VDW4_9SOLA|nr:hypothetical protein RND71_022285 [Anisodus tanguticus]